MTDHGLPGTQQDAAWSSGDSTLATSGAAWVRGSQWGSLRGTLAVAALEDSQMLFLRFNRKGGLVSVTRPSAMQQFGRLRSVTSARNGDLPFGSYQASPEQGYLTAVRFMKEAGAHCVKLEGGAEMAPVIEKCTQGGIPVMAHIGFTPQSEHTLGGYRVQGRGDASDRIIADARAVQEAGAFAVVMEMVPGDVAEQVSKELVIPTIGIGAGNGCDGQVLVWQDAFGLRQGRMARFVKQYADVHGVLLEAARAYADDVRGGTFPGPEHTF